MAPGPSELGRPGASLIIVLLLALTTISCGRGEPVEDQAIIELAKDTIRLESGVKLRDILVRAGTSSAVPLEPDTVQIQVGDVVRFISADRHPHSIAFETTLLTPAMEAYLRETNQLRGPPLLSEGAIWIIGFRDAPPGIYPFIDLSQNARGSIEVIAPEPAER